MGMGIFPSTRIYDIMIVNTIIYKMPRPGRNCAPFKSPPRILNNIDYVDSFRMSKMEDFFRDVIFGKFFLEVNPLKKKEFF